MASRKTTFLSKPSYMYPTSESNNPSTSTDHFELDEADLWSSFNEMTLEGKKQQLPTSRPSKKHTRACDLSGRVVAASSVPVNVPDWSKILKGEYRGHKNRDSDDDGDDADDGDEDHDGWVPPHEYLARRRGASFSVHEGIGRTLKGRDLSQVRNAIWKTTGFED